MRVLLPLLTLFTLTSGQGLREAPPEGADDLQSMVTGRTGRGVRHALHDLEKWIGHFRRARKAYEEEEKSVIRAVLADLHDSERWTPCALLLVPVQNLETILTRQGVQWVVADRGSRVVTFDIVVGGEVRPDHTGQRRQPQLNLPE